MRNTFIFIMKQIIFLFLLGLVACTKENLSERLDSFCLGYKEGMRDTLVCNRPVMNGKSVGVPTTLVLFENAIFKDQPLSYEGIPGTWYQDTFKYEYNQSKFWVVSCDTITEYWPNGSVHVYF
jgi:hypothetical protein